MTDRASALAIALLLSASLPQSALAFCHLTTIDPEADELCSSEGRMLAWFDRCSTIALLPRDKAGIPHQTILATLRKSFDTWRAVRCEGEPVGLVATVVDDPAEEDEPIHRNSGGNQNVVMFVDSEATWADRMNPPRAIGLTSVFHSKRTGQIVGADMELNDWRGTFGICGTTCGSGITDLENVITHEAGHYYGLGHVGDDDSEATMYYQAPAGDLQKRTLAGDDVAGICDTYPPGTFGESCTGSAYSDRFKDDGCGCSVPGGRRSTSWWWLLPALGVLGLHMRRRARDNA